MATNLPKTVENLREWLSRYELSLDSEDMEFVKDVLDESGYAADCSDSDWTLFVGDGFVVKDNHAGCRIDRDGKYSVRSWPTHCEIREVDDGLSTEELYAAVAIALEGSDGPAILVHE